MSDPVLKSDMLTFPVIQFYNWSNKNAVTPWCIISDKEAYEGISWVGDSNLPRLTLVDAAGHAYNLDKVQRSIDEKASALPFTSEVIIDLIYKEPILEVSVEELAEKLILIFENWFDPDIDLQDIIFSVKQARSVEEIMRHVVESDLVPTI